MNIGVYTIDFLPEDQSKAKTYECMKCSLVSEYNYCIDCNHCICTECLKHIKKCPIDNRVIDENSSFRFNYIGNNLLEALKINCIYKSNGCPWIGTKKQLEDIHYHKCLYRDNRRKLIDMSGINNFNRCENNGIINGINSNIEDNINNRKMMLRKKTKKKNVEYDEDLDEESSNSNFSELYLGKDESSVVEVDNSDNENGVNIIKNFDGNDKKKYINLNADDENNIMNNLNIINKREKKENNGLKIIKINNKNENFVNNDFLNKKKDKKNYIEINNNNNSMKKSDFNIIKSNKKNMDVIKLSSDDIFGKENKNIIQNDLINIKDDISIIKPKKNIINIIEDINYIKQKKDIISLMEDSKMEEIEKNKNKHKEQIQSKVFVFK